MTIASDKHLGIMIGIVLDKEDPDSLGRVKVRFPTLHNTESDWARVLVPFGGQGGGGAHGFFFRPKKDDEVIVGFENGNPRVPVVLGCVYSKNQKPPTSDTKDHVIQTPTGFQIRMSEVDGSAKLELKTPSGQRVTMDEGSKTVTVEGGQTVHIKSATTVKVESQSVTVQATNVAVDASSITLGGTAGSQPAVLGTILKTLLETHTHMVGTVMSSPPTPPVFTPGSFLSTKTKLAG